jgi:magnesium transporter
MARKLQNQLVHKRRRTLGLPPGSLVFTGEDRVDTARITAVDFDADNLTEHTLETAEETFPFRDIPGISWINVDGVHDVEVIRKIGEHYGVHPLVLEDIVHTEQRPKVEEYEDHLYVVVRMLYYDEKERLLKSEQVSLIVGKQYVLSFQETPGDVFEPVRERLRVGKGRLRKRGADYLTYALLDVIIDHYFLVLEIISVQIEDLEAEVLDDPQHETQQGLSALRRELILLRKAVWPVRELISNLERLDSRLIRSETKPFLRDAYDHTVQVIDIVESLRDMIGVLRDSYQAILGNRMNEIMKVLTIIATIFIPLTFIAGIYGMNFDNMPELHARYGYPIALLVMLVIGLGLGLFFKRKDWF